MKFKLFFLLFFLFIFSIKFYSSEKEIVKYYYFNNHISNFFNNNKIILNDSIKLFSFWDDGSTTNIYGAGVNLFIFGVASGIIGGALIGIGFLCSWLLSNGIGTSLSNTLASLIVSYSSFGNLSYLATLAICCWVLGGIFCALCLLFIPGLILMAVGLSRMNMSKRIIPADDAIGVTFKL